MKRNKMSYDDKTMILIRKIVLCILMHLFFNVVNANDSININQTILSTSYPNKFTGVSSMSMYELVKSNYDSSAQTYQTAVYNNIYDLLKPLKLKVLRFPGGTIGNYYHFYGRGHGIDTSETTCAPGRVGNATFANMHVAFDNRVNKNIIEYLTEELDTLEKYGPPIDIAFRINSHTHFYKYDLRKYTDSIQYLIYQYFAGDTAFLSTDGSSMDSVKINAIATKLMQLQQNTLYTRIKQQLARDTGFARRFKENMDAVAYLKGKGVNIIGAEIGNETNAEYVVFDDDFDYLGFDCTQMPANFNFNILSLPMKYYIEGMIKNNLIVSLYADSLKAKYNIVSGVPAATSHNYLTLNANYEPMHIKPYDLGAKKSDLWNKYYASQQQVFALIPHLYSQEFIDCADFLGADTIYGLPEKRIHKIAERFYKFFIDSLITYNLKRVNYYGNNKPQWITEWNFSDGSYANNTFLHALYNYYFIRKAIEIHDFSPNYVQILLYHHLVGASQNWPLIKVYNTGQSLITQQQITYHPFYIWSNTIAQQVKKVKTPFWATTDNQITDVFINNIKNELIIQFVNTDSVAHFIDLKKISITDNNTELIAQKIDRYCLDAENFISTNGSNCAFFTNPMYQKAYQVFDDSLQQLDTLWMPAISMGKFTLHLKNKLTTAVQNEKKNTVFRLFPNPAKEEICVQHSNTSAKANYQYMIYDSLGKLVANGIITQQNTTINIEKFARGNYVINVINNNEFIDSLKFIKY